MSAPHTDDHTSSSEPSSARASEHTITVRKLVDSVQAERHDIGLSVVGGHSGLDRRIRGTRVQKSGLALVGHFHGITPSRVQLLGVTELTYLYGLDDGQSRSAIARLFERDLCCVVVTESDSTFKKGSVVVDQLLRSAAEAETPLLLCRTRSSATITALHALLAKQMAPRARVHGVLVDVFEVGLLLLGSSGVGKSEVALELIMRGHRLVADDVVDCQYRHPNIVFGTAANLLRYHLEVRGLGILNIKNLFGVTAVRDCKRIDVVVQLAQENSAHDDRLGLEEHCYSILGVEIPQLLIPVRPGRDMASIMEVAARNELLKQAGHHPARDFVGKLENTLLGTSDHHLPARPRTCLPSSLAPPSPRPVISRPPESIVGYPWPSEE